MDDIVRAAVELAHACNDGQPNLRDLRDFDTLSRYVEYMAQEINRLRKFIKEE